MSRRDDLLRNMETPMVLGVELNRITLTPQRYPIRPVAVPETTKSAVTQVADLPMAKDTNFFRSLLAISSGTIATLTGCVNYAEITEIHSNVCKFYLNNQEMPYDSWVDVWTAYQMTPQ